MRPYTSTIFAEMSALALRTGAINLGQGFPDTDGPPSLLADAAANITGGVNQYPPGLGVPALRTAVAEHQRRFYGLAVDPDDVLITTGATEAIASAVLALCEPGRRGRHLRAVLRLLRRHHRARRRGAAARAAAAADVRLRPRRAARGVLRRARSSCWSTPRTTRPARCSPREQLEHDRRAGRRVRRGGRHRRGVRAHDCTTGAPHVPMATPARHGRAHADDLLGGQDVLRHRLEDRLGARAAPSWWRRRQAVKQFLTYVSGAPFQPAIATALGAARRLLRRPGDDLQRKRDLLPPGCAPPGSRCSPRRARTSSSPTPRRSASTDGADSAGSCRSSAAWRRCRCRCSASTPTLGPHAGPVRVLQARRGAHRSGLAVGRAEGGGVTADVLFPAEAAS